MYSEIALTILVLILAVLAWKAIDILLLLLASILFAIFLRTFSNFIKRKTRLSDSMSLSIVILAIILGTLLLLRTTIPTVGAQMAQLVKEMPAAWDIFLNYLKPYFSGPEGYNVDFSELMPQSSTILKQAASLFSSTFGFLGSLIVFLFLGIFLAYDPDTYIDGMIRLVPIPHRKKATEIINDINLSLRWWLIGKNLSMVIVGVLTTIGLWLMGIPMALALGILAAVMTFIPNIGPILAAIPAVLVAFIQEPISALYVILLYTVIQVFETYIITPIIQNKTVALPPVSVFVAQLVMALFTGILGLALATPLLAVLMVLVNKIYVEGVLHDH